MALLPCSNSAICFCGNSMKFYILSSPSSMLHNDNQLSNDALEKMTILLKISRELSARGIGTVAVNFGQLKATVKIHHKQSARPLVVIFLDGLTEVNEFKERIVTMDMSYSVWLVLFNGDNDRDSCEYCRSPTGNPFNLKSDTEMLISCCNSSYIAKWSPEKTNYTATLSRDEGIEKAHEIDGSHNGTLYNRQQLDIKELCIVIVQGSGYIWKEDNELHGYIGELVTELSRVMNFNLSCIMEESTSGAFDPETSMWTGAIGAVMQGKAHIGASEFTMTYERRSVVDFTVSIGTGEYRLYIRNPHHVHIEWTGFLQVFHQNIWIVILIFLLVTPLLLTIIQYTRKNNLFDVIFRNYLNVWGLFCQQGSSDSLHARSLKIIYLAILMSSIIVYASYSAALIRHLTTTSEHAPFHDIKAFIEDGTHKLIVIKDGVNHHWLGVSNDTQVKKMRKLLKPVDSLPTNRKEGFEQICKEKVAFLNNGAGKYLRENRVPCEVLSVKLGGMFHVGMILPLNSEYTELVNYHFQRFRRNGILDRLKRKYARRRVQATPSFKSVTFRDILPILTTFAIGFSFAFIIFHYETMK